MMAGQDKNIRGVILDMDGVLWRGDQPIGDLPFLFARMQALGWQITLATNNATRSIDQYVARLADYGVHINSDQIVNSAFATVRYLLRRFPSGGKVFVIGHTPLIKILSDFGFHFVEQEADAVVVGLDRGLTYEKLMRATLLIRSGAEFVATNPDRTFPVPEGLVPGAGALVAAIQAATDVEPYIVGKPDPEMYRVVLERMQLDPKEVLVIGDRLETDIAGGQALGCQTGVVLSGVSTLEEVRAWDPPVNYVAANLETLLDSIAPEIV